MQVQLPNPTTKVILVSQFPLPFEGVGSWTSLYQLYFESHKSLIDTLVCPKPKHTFKNVGYRFIPESIEAKVRKRLFKNPYLSYVESVLKEIEPGRNHLIQLVDNFGLLLPLHRALNKAGCRNRCQLQFFYHGFSPFFGNFQSRPYFEAIDQMVFLTQAAYEAHKNYYSIMPFSARVLHNGVDTNKFYPLIPQKRQKKLEEMGVKNKKIFIWCAQDRPKKGLDFLLRIWLRFHRAYPETLLWVVGTTREQPKAGVQFFGKQPHSKVAEYFQLAQVFLFTSLCQEGFGLTLAEALHCGCYPVASAWGGIPEVIETASVGSLVKHPHFEEEWYKAMEDALSKIGYAFERSLFTQDSWIEGYNHITRQAAESFG